GQIGCIFVHSTCRPRRRLWVAKPNTGESEGENGRRDALLVHRGDRLLWSPTQPRGMDLTAARCGYPIAIFSEIKRWDEVMVHIDQTMFWEDRCLRKDRPETSNTGTR